jgi:hypothetical protein
MLLLYALSLKARVTFCFAAYRCKKKLAAYRCKKKLAAVSCTLEVQHLS